MKPLLFYVLVKPRRAPATKGRIALTSDTREADEATNTVGEVVDLGSLAFKAKTPGLDYGDEPNAPKKGDWIRYSKHAGQVFSVLKEEHAHEATPTDEMFDKFVLITDTDVLAVIPQDEVKRHRGWI